MSSEFNRARDRVSQAIKRALKEIKNSLPKAEAHLFQFISTGNDFSYNQPPKNAWKVRF